MSTVLVSRCNTSRTHRRFGATACKLWHRQRRQLHGCVCEVWVYPSIQKFNNHSQQWLRFSHLHRLIDPVCLANGTDERMFDNLTYQDKIHIFLSFRYCRFRHRERNKQAVLNLRPGERYGNTMDVLNSRATVNPGIETCDVITIQRMFWHCYG